jgi:glycosyltransferase involved in cell wall biosynthesis
MKIAYLMLVHKNPQLLRRVLGILSSEDCDFHIHIDRKVDIGDFSGVSGENVFFSKQRIPVHWGEFSQVEATMLLMRQALSAPRNYDYFVFLQGSDYPLRSRRYIQEFLENNRGKEFISMVKVPAPGFPLSKINQLRYPSAKPVHRLVSKTLSRVGLAQRDYRKYLGRLEAYAGDACWALSRDACQYIVEFARCNPHVGGFFRNTFTPDEMFFHTILGNSPFRPLARRSLAYRDWPEPGHHPAMLDDTHVSFFEEQEKICVEDQFGPGEVLFARKFSDESTDLLERIDAMIMRQEEPDRSHDRSCRLLERTAPATKPLVSIIIPAYNANKWIADTIRSAVGQTWQPKEIIIVDDGSTDKTLAIARQFESESVRVVTQKNQGAATARNHAFQLSQGDYIQYLDADDLLAPDKIERQLAALRVGDSRRVLLSSPWASFYYRTRQARFVRNSLWQDLSPVEWLLRKMGENLYMQPATWLTSRELAQAAGPWDTRLWFDDDGEYFCRVLLASEGTRFVPETGVFYRAPGTNNISYLGISDKKRDSLLLSVKLHIQYLCSLEDSERVRRVCLEYLRTKCADFYPERLDIVRELQGVAAQFHGRLEIPQLRWKYAWMRPVLGRKTAKWAQVGLPQIKISLARWWDKEMFKLEAREAATSHATHAASVSQED